MAETYQSSPKVGEDYEKPKYDPSEKERLVVPDVVEKFRESRDDRDRAFDYLDGRTITQYIDDNVRRFITNEDAREGIEDWQSRVFDPFTRNKVISILSKVAVAMPKIEFFPVGDDDVQRASLLGDLYEHAEYIDDSEELMFNALLEAAVKGTVIGYEGYEEKRTKVRDIKHYGDGTELQLEDGEKITRKVHGSIVPLEDFYPSSVGVRRLSDMPYCFWRTVLTESEFKMKFNQYERVKFVCGYQGANVGEEGDKPFYRDYISNSLNEGEIEVIRYYNQDTDEFVIIANGIWLNPLDIGGGEEIMPIPFNHKCLPFWKAIYEPLGSDFFYGKSLPDKLKSMQDVINVLHNMMLDQSFLSIFPPILVDGNDDIEDDFLRPGRRIPVTNAQNYKELQISAPNSFHQYILEYSKRVLEETSVDSMNSGVADTGGERVTARAVEQASQSIASILGLFNKFISWGVRDRARLRARNILQFSNKPFIERVLGPGADENFKKAYNVIKLEDATLSTGKRGTKVIEMYNSREDMPTKSQLKLDKMIMEKQTGKWVEKIAINADAVRDFEFDVRLMPNRTPETSKAMEKALVLEKAKVYMEFMPEMIDKEQLAAEIAEVYGDKPERIMKKKQPEEQIPGRVEGIMGQMRGNFPGAGDMGVSKNMMNQMLNQQPRKV